MTSAFGGQRSIQLSNLTCRTQEARQRDIADRAPFSKVRAIATRAADAWAKEGPLAKKREERCIGHPLEAASIASGTPGALDDSLLSENPDRGLADD